MNRGDVALVTGAGGFIGSNLCRALVDSGFVTHVVVRPRSGNRLARPLPMEVTVHEADLRQPAAVSAVLAAVRPALVFNAAVSNAYVEDQRLSEVVCDTVLTLANILDACVEVDFPRFIHFGSSLEYGPGREKLGETNALEPTTVRGVTKAAATQLALHVARRDRRPITVLRPFSVYGPFEAGHRLVPQAIRAALTGEELPLTVPGLRHDFVFVDDVINACLLTANTDATLGEAINIGTGVETANEELVAEVERVLGREIRVRAGAYQPRETDSAHWRADITKARRLLGWEPRYTLAEGLERTSAWVESFLERGVW